MQIIQIENPSDADQRIDKFLKKYLTEASLWVIYKWLRTGKIKVNKKKVEQTYRIELGDSIEMHIHDEEIELLRKQPEIWMKVKWWQNSIEILYEDEVMMVVNKPPNMNVHPGDHKSSEASLIEVVHDMLWDRYNSLSFRPSLVHRIDRDTSGVLIIAKEKKALEKLLDILQSGKMEKIYHTIVLGKPPRPRDTIDVKLLRKEDAKDEAKVIVSPLGQVAVTHYRTLQENIGEKYSLLECHIETGRTHQIRVHMAHIGTPVLGDKAYGDVRENAFARKKYHIERQLLHAHTLIFPHPLTGKNIEVHAPYPEDFKDMISIQ
jgi:RluA family pseudouridine synthase